MHMRTRILTFLAAGLMAGAALLPSAASAAPLNTASMYRTIVTRVGSNVYKVDDQPNLVVRTSMCLELALGEAAYYDDSTNTIYFGSNPGSTNSCSVRGVYKVNLSLSRVDDNGSNTSGYTYYRISTVPAT